MDKTSANGDLPAGNALYRCAACDGPLFRAASKFDAGTGYPSYDAPARPESVRAVKRHSHGVPRVEVLCASCDAHLGHVFDDDTRPTGKRYCILSEALALDPGAQEATQER